jgi:hypothetical protein
MGLYLITNGPAPTTAAHIPVTTGTAIKTMLQVEPKKIAKIVEWGISFDGSAAATPIRVELLETDVAATVTAHVEASIGKMDDLGALAADALTFGTADTGYTASAEGTVAASRLLDAPQFVAPTSQFIKQYPLGREPKVDKGKWARIRVTAAAAVNAYTYMIVEV